MKHIFPDKVWKKIDTDCLYGEILRALPQDNQVLTSTDIAKRIPTKVLEKYNGKRGAVNRRLANLFIAGIIETRTRLLPNIATVYCWRRSNASKD